MHTEDHTGAYPTNCPPAGPPLPDSLALIVTGGSPVWPLPHTRACAEAARGIVRATVTELVPDRLDDCLVMASELATNAWLHGLGGQDLDDRQAPVAGRSELAIYRRGPETAAELVIAVFDPRPDLSAVTGAVPNPLAELPGKPLRETLPAALLDRLLPGLPDNPLPESPPDAVNELPAQWWSGRRGLGTVRELSEGRHGFYRTRSRLGHHCVTGKAAWFAIPLPATSPAARPPAPRLGPADAVRALHAKLSARGLGGMYVNDVHDRSLLSLRNVTVWSFDNAFAWTDDHRTVRVPYFDLIEAVEQIVRTSEDHEYAALRTRS